MPPDSGVLVVAQVIAASVAAHDAPLLSHSLTVTTALVAAFTRQLMCVTVSAASALKNKKSSDEVGDSMVTHFVD